MHCRAQGIELGIFFAVTNLEGRWMTELAEAAFAVDILGRSQLVVDDGPLLQWAKQTGSSLSQSQSAALREGIVPHRYLKNLESLSISEQERICSSTVVVCGCGGLGGVLIQLLARSGVGTIRAIDGDVFVPSNLNRQWFCDTEQISRSKVEAAADRVRLINPFVHVEPRNEMIDANNAERLLAGSDLVLDGLDNLPGRFALGQAARKLQIPFIHAAAAGWWGQISTFLPGSRRVLEDVYGTLRSRDAAEEAMGVPGVTVSVIGSLEALEALRILAGRKAAYADRLLYFDGETGRTETVAL